MYAYSPLHHVQPHTPYPAVLLITGENDPRVPSWQSRKFAAALQAANRSQQPILLLTRRNEGHAVNVEPDGRGTARDVVAFTSGDGKLRSRICKAVPEHEEYKPV
jgi:prolyl oligopeptidase PreP (S9A serine peptidase family)